MASSDRIRRGVGLLGALAIAAAAAGMSADRAATQEAAKVGEARVPDEWLEGTEASRDKRFSELKAGVAPPALKVADWKNSGPLTLADLKGKVVMLDFWATWCGPCIASIPHSNDLYDRYKADGLVMVGVCQSRGADKMAKTAEDKGIKYPIAADLDGKTVEAYAVDGFPDYYFIDRAGKLRILDCKNANVEDAIKLLLSEKAD
jgi:thiol-disulfide isomerase/thioredoxin